MGWTQTHGNTIGEQKHTSTGSSNLKGIYHLSRANCTEYTWVYRSKKRKLADCLVDSIPPQSLSALSLTLGVYEKTRTKIQKDE